MSILIKMAWFNIWRNRRRTLLVLCAMTAGLAGVLFSAALINGWMDEMVSSSVETFEGHVKVMGEGYHDNPVVEHSMEVPRDLGAVLDAHLGVRAWAERVALPALLSTPAHARVVNVIGVDPEREVHVSTAGQALREGRFLAPDDRNKILVGRQLADKIGIAVGKKVVLMAQQWGGDLGSGAFRVVGIFDTGAGGFNEGNVYVLKSDAQRVLNLGDRITEVVAMLHDIELCDDVAADLRDRLEGTPVDVLTWKDRIPLVAQYIEIAYRFIWPYYAIFYLAMAFGIVNALSMAIGERTYEIGVMLAVGMRRERIVFLILLEALFTAILAGITGVLVGGAIVGWLGHRGIDFSAFEEAMDYMGVGKVIYPHLELAGIVFAVVVMLVIALVFSLIPAVRAARMVPITALRTAR